MATAPTHTVPDGSIPLSAMKEEVSRAYVHMVASAAGLTLSDWRTDYDGIDVTLRSKVDYSEAGGCLGPQVDIQLKCSGQERVVHENHISWSLEVRTLRYLRDPNRFSLGVFCVMIVEDDDPGLWLRHDTDGLLARSQMYWVKGEDLPEPKLNQVKQTVHVPRENLFTAGNALLLVEESSRRTWG